jgi:hypothetical protein
MGSILLRGNFVICNSERSVCASERSHDAKEKRREKTEEMSPESTGEGHCRKIFIEGLVYLKLTPVVIQSREKAKMKWQPAGLGRQGNLSESNAKPCCRSWKAADEAFAVADDGDGTG